MLPHQRYRSPRGKSLLGDLWKSRLEIRNLVRLNQKSLWKMRNFEVVYPSSEDIRDDRRHILYDHIRKIGLKSKRGSGTLPFSLFFSRCIWFSLYDTNDVIYNGHHPDLLRLVHWSFSDICIPDVLLIGLRVLHDLHNHLQQNLSLECSHEIVIIKKWLWDYRYISNNYVSTWSFQLIRSLMKSLTQCFLYLSVAISTFYQFGKPSFEQDGGGLIMKAKPGYQNLYLEFEIPVVEYIEVLYEPLITIWRTLIYICLPHFYTIVYNQ